MSNPLKMKDSLAIGVLLFGLFFGAGNLIFPIFLGKSAGLVAPEASIGFLITAVGLPLLGVMAMGVSQSSSVFELSSHVHPFFGYAYTILLYLTIGPLFAIPRLCTVSFEVGLSHLLPSHAQAAGLLTFSFFFYMIVLYFALRPTNILTVVGKVLTPIFLLFLFALILVALINPVGSMQLSQPTSDYASHPLFSGLLAGYQTMDALAALAFGIIVIQSVKEKGAKDGQGIVFAVSHSAIICAFLMGVIYVALSLVGATTTSVFSNTSNGGQIFNLLSHHYFGLSGSILLFSIMTLACLKTGIGLVTALAETFPLMFPHSLSYRHYAYLVTGLSFLLANAGLDRIIAFSLPVLLFLYPLTIVLILLALASPLFDNSPRVFQLTLLFTTVASLGDFFRASPALIHAFPSIHSFLSVYDRYLPFSDSGLGWILPALLGAVCSYAHYIISKQNQPRY